MNIINWVLVGAIGVVVIVCLATTIAYEVKRRKNKNTPVSGTAETAAAENETEERPKAEANVEVSLEKSDVVIPAQKTIIASKNGTLKPGKYSILSADSGVDRFNVRIGKFVKEYKHGDVVVVADGEEVTPTSHKIILR